MFSYRRVSVKNRLFDRESEFWRMWDLRQEMTQLDEFSINMPPTDIVQVDDLLDVEVDMSFLVPLHWETSWGASAAGDVFSVLKSVMSRPPCEGSIARVYHRNYEHFCGALWTGG